MRLYLLIIIVLLFASLLILPTVGSTTAQSPSQTGQPDFVPITLLYPDAQFTIRVDAEFEILDLTALNFRWVTENGDDVRFDLSASPQLAAYAASLSRRQCIQLYVAQPNQVVPLCTGGVLTFPVRAGEEFWNPQDNPAFSVYQGDTHLMTCTTAQNICTVEWSLAADATPSPPTIVGMDDPTPLPAISSPTIVSIDAPTHTVTPVDGQDNPNLLILASNNELILMVTADEPISLEGFQYGVAITTQTQFALIDFFDVLSLVDEMAEPDACYILQRADANDVPPIDCDPDNTYRHELNDSDVFWYDNVRREGRSIAVYNRDILIGVCPALTTGCTFSYDPELVEIVALPTIPPTTPPPITPSSPTPTPRPANTNPPANGQHLDIFYNNTNFYIRNLGDTNLVISNLRLQGITRNNSVTRSFNGNLWAEFYAYLEGNRGCVEIDTSSRTSQPSACRAVNGLVTFYDDPFWVTHDDAVEFEVVWNRVAVGRCPLATTSQFLHCDVYVQP
jgi:hypothetical protein